MVDSLSDVPSRLIAPPRDSYHGTRVKREGHRSEDRRSWMGPGAPRKRCAIQVPCSGTALKSLRPRVDANGRSKPERGYRQLGPTGQRFQDGAGNEQIHRRCPISACASPRPPPPTISCLFFLRNGSDPNLPPTSGSFHTTPGVVRTPFFRVLSTVCVQSRNSRENWHCPRSMRYFPRNSHCTT